MGSRKMLIFTRLENCITIQVVGRKTSFRRTVRSNNFYITKGSIQQLLDKKYLVSRDIYNFLEAIITPYRILLNFSWLSSNGFILEGQLEELSIDLNEFIDWYKSDRKSYRTLEILNNDAIKINFKNTDRLKEVLGNKVVKNKFLKILKNLQSWHGDEIRIYNDFALY